MDDEIASNLTPVEFSGYFSPVTSDNYLASSGASLDDGSTPGSVTVAFEDPELIAMQGGSVGDIANVNSGSTAGSNSPGDGTASTATDGVTGNLASNDGSSADGPSYQFFLDDGSGDHSTGNLALNSGSSADQPLYQDFLDDGSSANPDGSTSGDIAFNAGTLTDSPLYDVFLDDASNTGAGVYSSSLADDVSISSSSPMGGDVSPFNTDSADVGTGPSVDSQVAGSLTSFPEISLGDISSSSLGTDLGTANSEPNLFMEGSDLTLAQLPTGDGTFNFNDGADPSLFADSLSSGTDIFSTTARRLRRQELQNPYPASGGWKMMLRRREKNK